VAITAIGVWFWQPMTPPDWAWMALLCVTGASGHYLLIRCYEVAEASAVQPFAYFQLVFVTLMAVPVFGERITPNLALGATIVVGAGLFTAWRERQVARAAARRAKLTGRT
jgi:drug/metabolite transporter (DMT)-like permease